MTRFIKSKEFIEIVSIAGIAAVFVFAEVNFNLFAGLAEQINTVDSAFTGYGVALLAGAWIGLIAYSLRRRSDLKREMKARETVEEDFALQQITDAVTGLPNRIGFELVLNQRLQEEQGRSFTIVSVEICNHDTITSVHGSEIAVRVEASMAEKLAEILTQDDFLALESRATFYAFAVADTVEETRFRIDGIIDEVAAFAASGIEANGLRLQTYVTYGLVNIDGELTGGPFWDAENVMRRVDFAALKARRRGNESIEVFDWSMESDMNQRAMIEASLGKAIKTSQIIPFFQPLIDLSTHRVTGLEILARWMHPVQGTIPPSTFIPIAEDTGVLRQLTMSVLNQACEAAREWPAHIRLAINISPTDLRDSTLIDNMIAALEESGTPAERIEVEITENALVEESGSITKAITKLKDAGISLSIDDFGTGYSSLHHLRILPFDKIKIDQSFIKEMATNKESKAIVQAIIAMAQSLGLKTTAEGIEIDNNAEILQELGCSIGQGFLYAKPLPAEEVLPFLEKYESRIGEVSKVA